MIRYHDGTKHHFDRFARSLGYLDWASQPNPFREYAGAAQLRLHPAPDAAAVTRDIGDLLRHSLGLSAWKEFHTSRWSLRVNPSSGNLHPTEAYVVCGRAAGLADAAAVYHYAADRHALEERCLFDDAAWRAACGGRGDVVLVALTSIHWREAWKYGERAFRYCQHDLGHAVAAISIAATLLGWRAAVLPSWPQRDVSALVGVDRDEDFVEAEREEPGCVIALTRGAVSLDAAPQIDHRAVVAAVREGRWFGRASQLSEDHVQWTFIDEVAAATEDRGRSEAGASDAKAPDRPLYPRPLILQRRSALALDGESAARRDTFMAMLARVMPGGDAPWNALWWSPRVHLAFFVHRVTDVEPGLYLLVRDPAALERLQAACTRDFAWMRMDEAIPLYLLARGDCRTLAARLSCNQDIAADGFFSLGMIADFEKSLAEFGASFYRHLFWETGVVGQVLYLEAEAAGARATGIGCFFDDPMHDVLGLRGHAFQSLYHFTVGMPIEDTRLTTERGYEWELR